MKHFIIGTAGHVDHGKTVLVKALTGKDTDRLKEEKERGISIELGFAPFKLPSGITAGLVDVPGHERFIKNMLAGVGGMDLVLLVVAADEGIMPQTREHLDIIDLLQITEGIIVITKTDVVEEDWTELVVEEVRDMVRGTVMENAPVARVSAYTGEGIPELIGLIDQVAGKIQARSASGRARMPIDRVFSITGFGTVVTGTLVEGILTLGDSVEILPQGLEARVRSLQVHDQKVEMAEAGQRVAANLAGIEREDIKRGSVLGPVGTLKPSHRLDIQLRLLPGAGKNLVNRARVRVHIGTVEALARVVLLEADELAPGETAFAQLECEQPVVSAKGDRLVIRSYSPMHTIGGGKIVDPLPPKRKRLDVKVIETLRTKEKGTPEELIIQHMVSSAQFVFSEEELVKNLHLEEETVKMSLESLLAKDEILRFSVDFKAYFLLSSVYQKEARQLLEQLEKYHRDFSLRPGLSKEAVRSKQFKGVSVKQFNAVLDQYCSDGIIEIEGENIFKQGFVPGPQQAQVKLFREIEEIYQSQGNQTPGWDEISSKYSLNLANSEEILNYFVNRQILIKLDDGILIHRNNMTKVEEILIRYLQEHKEISLGEARDLLHTTRKYALPMLNYFDKVKITRRVDDKRILY